ncbi:hypothetical protein Glove_33g59 [Diversispora epigaea]|uniref:Uncharacterized protein n=1 Tax=Diversispora epigaea TaxID=1348612 RepID=A0A397JGY7_9GLOM|nr:hypothetical protein Glove_33g59 [Diversispora epigaea]
MASLPFIIEEYIVKTNERLNKKPFSFETLSSVSHGSKVIIRSLSYGTIDNYIVYPLSTTDMKKFYTLLLQLSLSCRWTFQWVNKPEAEELFNFLNLYLKLPDRRLLGDSILKDQIGVILTFDNWTNVHNEQLLGTVTFTSEGQPYTVTPLVRYNNVKGRRRNEKIDYVYKLTGAFYKPNRNQTVVCLWT